MANAKMVVEIGEFRFEKYAKASTVNIYVGETNTDCFTHYNIGTDIEKFEESCEEHYKYMMENHQ